MERHGRAPGGGGRRCRVVGRRGRRKLCRRRDARAGSVLARLVRALGVGPVEDVRLEVEVRGVEVEVVERKVEEQRLEVEVIGLEVEEQLVAFEALTGAARRRAGSRGEPSIAIRLPLSA